MCGIKNFPLNDYMSLGSQWMLTFSKQKSFKNTIRVSNSLDPDQTRHFVGPDLGPSCLDWLSAEDKKGKELSMEKNTCI